MEPAENIRKHIASLVRGSVQWDVDASTFSRWQIGGNVQGLVDPPDKDSLVRLMRWLSSSSNLQYQILGATSNVLFDSAGYDGLVIRIGTSFARHFIQGGTVTAQAGVSVPDLADAVAVAGLSGLQHTAGIPGTIGGLVAMNGGSQRKGIGSQVKWVECVTHTGELVTLDREACNFAYRRSAFQDSKLTIVEVGLELEPGDPEKIHSENAAIRLARSAKFPEGPGNCGSTFVSDPAMYASVGPPGLAIEQAGLKGVERGGAQISPVHANFFVNRGGATSDEILWLIALARNTVRERTGYSMNCEVKFLNKRGPIAPAHEVAIQRWGKSLTAASEQTSGIV